MPRLELRRQSRRNPLSLVLDRYRRDMTSQNGEDGIIERIFEIVGATNRWCVEFGAWDGKVHRNTWNLIANNGWTGVLIEGERDRFEDLKRSYADLPQRVHLVHGFVALQPGGRLDDILTKEGAPIIRSTRCTIRRTFSSSSFEDSTARSFRPGICGFIGTASP
jgi:hypothetical protein